jgi:PAS domain S-box-containing protein
MSQPAHDRWLSAATRTANEARFRALLEALSTFVWIADPSGAFAFPQEGWERYTGHGFDRHGGNGWIEDVHPGDRDRVSDRWHTAVRDKSWHEVEWRCWHGASKSWRRCLTRAVPILNVDGTVKEWVGAVRDIESELHVDQMFEREWLRQAQTAAGLAILGLRSKHRQRPVDLRSEPALSSARWNTSPGTR